MKPQPWWGLWRLHRVVINYICYVSMSIMKSEVPGCVPFRWTWVKRSPKFQKNPYTFRVTCHETHLLLQIEFWCGLLNFTVWGLLFFNILRTLWVLRVTCNINFLKTTSSWKIRKRMNKIITNWEMFWSWSNYQN